MPQPSPSKLEPHAPEPTARNPRPDEEELRRIPELIAVQIQVLDPDGRPIYANHLMLDYFGVSLEDVRAQGFRKRVFHPEDVERLRDERRKRLSESVPFENEQRALGKDGEYRWFLIRYNPLLDAQGKVIRWYATGTDIDDRKRAEDRMRNETVALREDILRSSIFEEVVGASAALRKVLAQVAKVAPTDSSVLIEGETGTGKELIARAIHNRSSRASRAFIPVNCERLRLRAQRYRREDRDTRSEDQQRRAERARGETTAKARAMAALPCAKMPAMTFLLEDAQPLENEDQQHGSQHRYDPPQDRARGP